MNTTKVPVSRTPSSRVHRLHRGNTQRKRRAPRSASWGLLFVSFMVVILGLSTLFAVHEIKNNGTLSTATHDPALSNQNEPSPETRVGNSISSAPSPHADYLENLSVTSTGDDPALTLFMDSFNGSGPLLESVPQEDLHGGGWKSGYSARQPRRDNGLLVSGGGSSTAAVQLPPISPHGEISISARVVLRGNAHLSLGLATGASGIFAQEDGPFVQVMGDGRLALCANAGTRMQAIMTKPAGADEHIVALVILYRLWNRSLSVYADGTELANMAMPKSVGEANRWLTISFASASAKERQASTTCASTTFRCRGRPCRFRIAG